jgi:hypothetical protein
VENKPARLDTNRTALGKTVLKTFVNLPHDTQTIVPGPASIYVDLESGKSITLNEIVKDKRCKGCGAILPRHYPPCKV